MNPYKVLQVDPEAEAEVIEAAYKRLAGKYHPDKNAAESATARMQEINAAYEVLKDPHRRAQYDRKRAASVRPAPPEPDEDEDDAEDDEPAIRHNTARPVPAPTVEQISNNVVWKLLVVGALIALLFYVPWLAVLGGCLWGLAWFFRRYPGPTTKLVGGIITTIVAAGAWFWVVSWQRDQRRKEEVQRLDLPTVVGAQLDQFRSSCTTNAAMKAPELASAYCACVAEGIRARFDLSPIHADSVYDYERAVSARFDAAGPTDADQNACVEQVRPKAAPAVTTLKRQRMNNAPGLYSKPIMAPSTGPAPELYSKPIGEPSTR